MESNLKLWKNRNLTFEGKSLIINDVGKNTLLNRFCDLNNMIDKSWLEMSLDTHKVKCKELFLRTDDD